MDDKQIKSYSKFLSLVLRHKPEVIGLALDAEGWSSVDVLLKQMAAAERPLSRELLEEIVANNDKKRFAFSEDGTRIRASQGHSVAIDLGLQPATPPEYLYHGTVSKFLESIRQEGLKKMSRQHVHLSRDRETALNVGSRRGVPLVLVVRAGAMLRQGHVFYISENGVWLTDEVPVSFIEFS